MRWLGCTVCDKGSPYKHAMRVKCLCSSGVVLFCTSILATVNLESLPLHQSTRQTIQCTHGFFKIAIAMAEKRTGTSANLFIDEDIDDSLLDSPVQPTQKPKEQASKAAHSFKQSYGNKESRDAALRQELANVRKVNETIEGVIESLDKAKTNMTVGNLLRMSACTKYADRQPDCRRRIVVVEHVDSHPLPNRAQPTPHLGPDMARRKSRHGRHGDRSSRQTTSSRAQRGGGAREKKQCCKKG